MALNNHEVESPKLKITATDDSNLWDKDWNITLRKEDKVIGTISFAGEKALGTIPIQIKINEAYQGQGYGREALTMMVDWAFRFKNIYEITAVTDRENDKAVKALKKAGFVYREAEGRMETYSITKAKTAWTGLYLFLGVVVGLIFGIVFSHVIISIIVGVLIGVSIGLSMDMASNKERAQVTGQNLK